MSNASDIREKLEQLSTDMALTHRFVHGTDTETVPLGTPPLATPSLRKMAKDIDARESAKADAVIAGATDRINAEGAAQEARVLAAGEVQTARVNEAGDTQFRRVSTEGNTQFERVNTEGNTQYARVNEAGEAQTAQVNAAGQTQHTAITTTANALLIDIGTLGTVRKEEITSTGAAFLLQIGANGDVQNSRLTATGAAENQKLKTTGDAQRLIVILEGDTQVQRLTADGNAFNATLLTLVREAAQSAAEAAQSASNAVDMTHVGPAGKGKFGFVRVGSGIDVTEEGEISVAFPAVVSTPAVAFPPVVGIGYSYELSMSAESAVYGANIATFLIAMDEDYLREIPAVNNAATHTLPIAGVSGTTGRIVVTAVDDLGNMSLDSVTTFQRNTVTIATPRVLSPVDAATDVSLAPLVTVQPMQVSGVPATLEHTQLQISTLEDFSDCVVVDTGEDAPYVTQYQLVDDLQKNTVYYLRVRHRASLYGWSAWSAATMFETMDCFVDVPTIYAPLNDITDVALRPTVSVAAFTNTGPVDMPTASQIQIATDAAFAHIVAQHDGGYVTTFAPATDLALITPYFARARHKGARWDWSAWSLTTRFTTLNAYTLPAALTFPANGAVNVPLLATLRVADFASVGPTDTATATHMQVALDADFANIVAEYDGDYTVAWTLPAFLTKNTGHFARARHKGARWGWGQWGAVAAFTSEDAFVRTPTVTAPTNGSTGVALRPTVSFSAFANAGPVDNAMGTHFQVARDAAFTNLIHDSGEAGGYVASWTPGSNLELNAPHYVRVRHKGALWGWSAWSAVVGFTTLNAFVNAPTVTAPANNATGVALRPAIVLSAFLNVGPADVGNGTQIQIALDAAFTNVVASYASAYTESWTPGNTLGINTPFFVRARHSGTTWGWSAWSAVVQFQTLNVTLSVQPLVSPPNGATGVALRPIFKTAVPVATNQTFSEDNIMVSTDNMFVRVDHYAVNNPTTREATIPVDLPINTKFYVRAYAQGHITGYTFGPITEFTTVNGWVNAPTITSPVANATVPGDEVYLSSSAFFVAHTTDTHVATEFCLNKVVNGVETGAWGSGELTGANLLAFKANIPDFEEGVQYKAYVRHKGQNLGWSAWSGGVPIALSRACVGFAVGNISRIVNANGGITTGGPFTTYVRPDYTFDCRPTRRDISTPNGWCVELYNTPFMGTPVAAIYSAPRNNLQCIADGYGYMHQTDGMWRTKMDDLSGTAEFILQSNDPSAAFGKTSSVNGTVFWLGRNCLGGYYNARTGEKLINYIFTYTGYPDARVSRGFYDAPRNRVIFLVGPGTAGGESRIYYTSDGRNWAYAPFPVQTNWGIEEQNVFFGNGLGDVWANIAGTLLYASNGLNFVKQAHFVSSNFHSTACVPRTKTIVTVQNKQIQTITEGVMRVVETLDTWPGEFIPFYK